MVQHFGNHFVETELMLQATMIPRHLYEAGPYKQAVPHHVVHRPLGRLGLTEATVGGVPRCQGDVMAGAGEEQLRAVNDSWVTAPVRLTSPPTTLHLQPAAPRKGQHKPKVWVGGGEGEREKDERDRERQRVIDIDRERDRLD